MADPRLTVVLLNWARPGNVRRLADQYLRMAVVADVVVFDCSGSFDPGPLNDRVVLVRAAYGGDPGLVARFAAAALARTRDVLLADDDIEVPGPTVDRLYARYRAVPARPIVGLFGRCPAADGTYSIANCHGDVPVVLTRAAVVSRDDCCRAADFVHDMVAELGGEPYGNGEDIILSYVASHAHNRPPNVALDLPYKNAGYDDANAISVRYRGHEQHRTRVVRWCRRRFGPDAG